MNKVKYVTLILLPFCSCSFMCFVYPERVNSSRSQIEHLNTYNNKYVEIVYFQDTVKA